MGKKILTLNIGASAVTLAEYEQAGSKLTLVKYGKAQLAAPQDAGNAETILSPALLEIVREKGIKPGKVAVSLSGQMVFPRTAAIPFAGNDQAKFDSFVRGEIEQNVPVPIDEMVCDRYVLGDTENGDKSVLIVAAKLEQVEGITGALQAAGFSPEIVDVAPVALTNVLKANGAGEECAVILDLGAKTSSLIIVEDGRFYNRSIPVAGNTLSNEIAKNLGCSLEDAENWKFNGAYVSQGGVTEDEDPQRDIVSKACRTVMTRLHAELSRSINFYRSQQGGGTPAKLYLTGGTSLLPGVDVFFQESLGLEVEYLNPFEAIGLGSKIDQAAIESDIVFLAATAGAALHAADKAAIKINLMPPALVNARAEAAQVPAVIAGSVMFIAAAALLWLSSLGGVEAGERAERELNDTTEVAQTKASAVKAADEKLQAKTKEAAELSKLVESRSAQVIRLNAVSKALGDTLWVQRWDTAVKEEEAPLPAGAKPKRNQKPQMIKVETVTVTVRGWKDQVADYVSRASGEAKTAAELVKMRLMKNDAVDPESVKIVASERIGKGGCLEQFKVEMRFK